MSMVMKKSDSNLVFDLISDGEVQCRVTRGLLVQECGDDVNIFIGQGDVRMLFKAIEALSQFAVRTGYGEELMKFLERGNGKND